MIDDYIEKKREQDRKRYEIIREYIQQGKDVSVADKRFYAFYCTCVIPKGGAK